MLALPLSRSKNRQGRCRIPATFLGWRTCRRSPAPLEFSTRQPLGCNPAFVGARRFRFRRTFPGAMRLVSDERRRHRRVVASKLSNA
jgi:hypothetical protein